MKSDASHRFLPIALVSVLAACGAPAPIDVGRDAASRDAMASDAAPDRDASIPDDASSLADSGQDAARPDAARLDGGPGSEVVGTVGPYASMHLGDHPIYSIDMAHEDYAIHYNGVTIGTGTSTHHPDGWWDGGAFSRMTPPTVDGLERGIAIHDVWRGATLAIQEINLRFEWRGSGSLGSLWSGGKFLISHFRETLAEGDAETRPMLFAAVMSAADDPAFNRPFTFSFAPAQGTVQAWGPDGYFDTYPPLSYWPSGAQSFYMADADDLGTGTFAGRPLFASDEYLTFEVRIQSIASAELPHGLIALRVYRRNGEVYERGAPFDIDAGEDLGDYFAELQQFGCGQYNVAPAPSPDLYMDVGGYITLAREYGGWMGPRAGFVE